MFNLKKKFVALVMAMVLGSMLSTSVFGQKGGDRDRPPKPDNNKVVVKVKEPRPPQNNNQPPPPRNDKPGKPSN